MLAAQGYAATMFTQVLAWTTGRRQPGGAIGLSITIEQPEQIAQQVAVEVAKQESLQVSVKVAQCQPIIITQPVGCCPVALGLTFGVAV